jgi:hypothetical protein
VKRTALLFVALVALLVVGAAIWTIAAPTTETPRAAPTDARAPAPAKTPRPHVAPEPPPKPEPPAPEPATPAVPPPASPPRALVRFMLEGLDSAIPAADSNVDIVREGQDGRAAEDSPVCSANGGSGATFEVDVTPLLPANANNGMRLGVSLDRDGYMPFTGHANVWLQRRSSKSPEATILQVQLKPAGWARGVVQDERFARVADAIVGSFVKDGNYWRRVDESHADARGEFRIRLLPGAANLVVAVSGSLAPTSVTSTGVARAETTLTPFTLQPGLAISGTIRRGNGHGVEDARIYATPIWAKPEFHLGPHWLAYPGGQVVECPAIAAANDGVFSVAGLVPGDYELTIGAPEVANDLLATLKRRASPPLESVAFVVDGATLVVDATCEGHPAPQARFAVINDAAPPESNTTGITTDRKGSARLLVQPGAQYRVEIDVKAYEPERRTIAAPALGGETHLAISLERRLARPKLAIVLRPEDTEGVDAVTAADVRLFFEDDTPSKTPDIEELATFSKGAAIVTTPWAGSYRVVVAPRGGGFRLPALARATVKDGEQTNVAPKFPHGGRLHLVTHDGTGAPIAVAFRVVAEGGEEIASGQTNGDDPLLPAGRQRLEFTPPGQSPRPVEALVKADETTRLELEFAAPRKGE